MHVFLDGSILPFVDFAAINVVFGVHGSMSFMDRFLGNLTLEVIHSIHPVGAFSSLNRCRHP
jgi:hypothetical protein